MVMAPSPMRETSRPPRRAFFMFCVLSVWFSGVGRGHVPQFGDGGAARAGHHEGDALGDVPGLQRLGDGVRGGEFVPDCLVVVEDGFGWNLSRLVHTNPDWPVW